MYLRDASISVAPNTVIPAPHTPREFNLTTHAVTEAFIDALPRRKVTINNIAKLHINIGARIGPDGLRYRHLIDIGEYSVPDFDLSVYFSATRTEQQRILLRLLREAIHQAASKNQQDPALAFQAIDQVERQSFPLKEFSDEELNIRWGLKKK